MALIQEFTCVPLSGTPDFLKKVPILGLIQVETYPYGTNIGDTVDCMRYIATAIADWNETAYLVPLDSDGDDLSGSVSIPDLFTSRTKGKHGRRVTYFKPCCSSCDESSK